MSNLYKLSLVIIYFCKKVRHLGAVKVNGRFGSTAAT